MGALRVVHREVERVGGLQFDRDLNALGVFLRGRKPEEEVGSTRDASIRERDFPGDQTRGEFGGEHLFDRMAESPAPPLELLIVRARVAPVPPDSTLALSEFGCVEPVPGTISPDESPGSAEHGIDRGSKRKHREGRVALGHGIISIFPREHIGQG